MLPKKNLSLPLYLDITSEAYKSWKSGLPERAFLHQIAETPQAIWINGASYLPDIAKKLTDASAQGKLCVLVLYSIPGRDNGGYSAGGADGAESYRAFVDQVCNVIGNNHVIAVVEPDAVPHMLDKDFRGDRELRTELLQYAVGHLSQLENTDVYLDVGHSEWPDLDALKKWLQNTQLLDRLTGLSMNVSSYQATDACLQRARQILNVGDEVVLPLIVDCSRNGGVLAPAVKDEDYWCNPLGALLGQAPSLDVRGFHGQLWIKRPGESDGLNNGGSDAGVFDLELCRRLCGLA